MAGIAIYIASANIGSKWARWALVFPLSQHHLPTVPVETPRYLLDLGVSRPVFDCKWPETRAVVEELWASRPHHLYDRPYDGLQDDLGDRFLDAWRTWATPVVRIASDLKFSYATMGSTEAIRETLALHAMQRGQSTHDGRKPTIHIFDGEYEGYPAQFDGYGGAVVRHDRAAYAESMTRDVRPGDRFYVSQPSAIDGNVWAGYDEFIAHVEHHHPDLHVFADLSYVGAVGRNFTVRVDSPVIRAAFVSLSKPLGVYYHRVGGVFSRDALPGLYGNRWFKTSFGLALGIALCERFGVHEIPRRYSALQRQETMRIAHETGIALAPSDAVLLAHGPAAQPHMPDDIAALRRGDSVRLCLTPSLERAFPRA